MNVATIARDCRYMSILRVMSTKKRKSVSLRERKSPINRIIDGDRPDIETEPERMIHQDNRGTFARIMLGFTTSRLQVRFAPSTHLPLLLSNPSLSVHPRTQMQRREYPHKLPTPILIRGAHTSRHKAVRPNQEHAMIRQAGRPLPALLAC